MNKNDGKEYLDPTPVAVPVGFGRPESLQETIRRLVRTEVSRGASQAGFESFEEANDFDVDDDEFVTSHELRAMENEFINEEMQNEQSERANAELRKRVEARLSARSHGGGHPDSHSRADGVQSGRGSPRVETRGKTSGTDEGRTRRPAVDHGKAEEGPGEGGD